jgi:hypothetical protein
MRGQALKDEQPQTFLSASGLAIARNGQVSQGDRLSDDHFTDIEGDLLLALNASFLAAADASLEWQAELCRSKQRQIQLQGSIVACGSQ